LGQSSHHGFENVGFWEYYLILPLSLTRLIYHVLAAHVGKLTLLPSHRYNPSCAYRSDGRDI
jgi:hypothetical protein